MNIKTSETREIRRCEIRLNPYNPKRHSDKQIAEQKRNLKRVGFLGGVVWNERTGNIVDGHRRIKALDIINKYDGTPETDYVVKVEVVHFDEKQEKEQLTYMAMGNTKADYDLIAKYLPDIDYASAGLDDYDLSQIQCYLPDPSEPAVETVDDFISEEQTDTEDPEPTYEEKREAVKQAKADARSRDVERWEDLSAYITISFKDMDEKRTFCELAGISETESFITGEKVLNIIE